MRNEATWLHYDSPLMHGTPVAFYNSITPKHSSESTFFATNTQGHGYMGLQQVEKAGSPINWYQGQAIFSIWDSECNEIMDESACPEHQRAQIIECGEMAVCSRFGNEGTGQQSKIRFDEWEVEQTYGFLVQAFSVAPDRVQYEGYFHAAELGGWVLLSKIQVQVRGAMPWYLHRMGSFVEQWDGRSNEDLRWARFGPAFVESDTAKDSWVQVRSARFSHTEMNPTSHVHVEGKVEGAQWGMGIGGDLVRTTYQQQILPVPSSPVPQDLLLFGTLRGANQLPGGCLDGTCTGTLIKSFIETAFSKQYFFAPILGLLACCCFCAQCCFSCWRVKSGRHPCICADIACCKPRCDDCFRGCLPGRAGHFVSAENPRAVEEFHRQHQPKPGRCDDCFRGCLPGRAGHFVSAEDPQAVKEFHRQHQPKPGQLQQQHSCSVQ
jgi:hypothetical protein